MSTPDIERDELVAAILRATAEMSTGRAAFTQVVAERFGLAATDVDCLGLLASEGAKAVGRLGEITALTTGATTRMVDRLEQAGYVRRVPDPADRRRVIVEPVAERTIAVARAFEPLDAAIRAALSPAPPADALEGSGLPACEAATPAASGARARPMASREPATVVSRKDRMARTSSGGVGERVARIAPSSGSKARVTATVRSATGSTMTRRRSAGSGTRRT